MEDRFYEIKEELLAKAKELAENDDAKIILSEVNSLKKKWRTKEEDESFLESEMKAKFDTYLDKIYAKAGKVSINVEEAKNEIINKAKELLNETNYKKANEAMNDLFNEWKSSGRTSSKEKDDELWAQFKEIKDEFFAKKNEYYDNLKVGFEKAKVQKTELIEKAIKANEITDFKQLSNTMNSLFNEWKKVPSAGRSQDKELWNQFLEQRKIYSDKKNAYFESMKEVYAARVEQKNELIAKAKRFLAISEFTKEEEDGIKALREEWKKVGNAGKENENDLWNEFNRIITKYFDNKKAE